MKDLYRNHEICKTRKKLNQAILNRDVDTICSLLAPDYFVLTGRGVQSFGVQEQHRRWLASFKSDPIVCYRRHTRDLRIDRLLTSAEELGRWVGKYSQNQQVVIAAGVYSAKWQKQDDGKWKIQAELFTTLKSKII